MIVGLKAPFDLLYYEVPEQFKKLVQVGTRIMVPYGENNKRRTAIVFYVSHVSPSFNLKNVSEVIDGNSVNTKIIELFNFTSDTFLIPLHMLVNEYIGTIESNIFVKFVECTDEAKLLEITRTSKGKKQQLATYLLKASPVKYATLRKKIGTTIGRYIVEFEKSGAIKVTEKNVEKIKRLFSITKTDSSSIEAKIIQFESSIRNSALKIVKTFLKSKEQVIDEATLTYNVRNSAKAIEKLVEVGILNEACSIEQYKRNEIKPKRELMLGGSLVERTNKIISLIKNIGSPYKTLVVFPELALIEKVKDIYKEAFGESCIVWDGRDSTSFINKTRSNRNVILATEAMLFSVIENLDAIILEDATSKYFKPNSFSPYEVRAIAIKKSSLENLDLLFSSSTADDSLFYLLKRNFFDEVKVTKPPFKVKVIDMRTEFKSKNRNMISYYLKRRINESLKSNSNVALILNRKPYSTFVMCRECGYVMKCKNCGSTLCFDSERKTLYCPVCGYEETPPDLCPRCKSPNIYYFGGGIQKLIQEIKSTFEDTDIVKMVSGDYGNRLIVDSKDFESTIFVGTEFLLSHIKAENIALLGFVSVDTFVESYGHESGVNAFKIVLDAVNELHGKEIILQTYTPENYVVNAMKSLDFKKFLDQELYLRKFLNYPPFFNLAILEFQNVRMDKTKVIKEYLEENLNNQAQVLGPSKGNLPNTLEITIKIASSSAYLIKEALKSASSKFKVKFDIRIYPSFVDY